MNGRALLLISGTVLAGCVSETGKDMVSTSPYPGKCRIWQAEIDPALTRAPDSSSMLNSEEATLAAMECLLMLQGRKDPARFGRATRLDTSELIPQCSVEVAALYYVTYLFTGDWGHAGGVALVGRKGRLNTDKAVRIAYKAYRTWLEKVKVIGLTAAREQELDPLEGTGVSWY